MKTPCTELFIFQYENFALVIGELY